MPDEPGLADIAYPDRIDAVDRALEARMASYPERDENYHALCRILAAFADTLIDETAFDTTDTRDELESLNDHPVFICGSMKSGTTLLTQLLDSHPDLFVMPGDSGFIATREKWQRSEFRDIARHWVHRLINPTGKRPFWFMGKEKERFESFLQKLRRNLEGDRHTVFSCVVQALAGVLTDPDAPPRYWVEKNPHNELHAESLLEEFPGAKFIHILRDPLENIASLERNAKVRGWTSTPFQRAHELKKLFAAARQNRTSLGAARYHVLRYEELVSTPESTLRELCHFLDIPYRDSMLIPTEAGKEGMSNSMYESDRVTGVIMDRTRESRYEQELTPAEVQDIVTVLYNDATALGYDWSTPAISRMKRHPLRQLGRQVAMSLKNRL